MSYIKCLTHVLTHIELVLGLRAPSETTAADLTYLRPSNLPHLPWRYSTLESLYFAYVTVWHVKNSNAIATQGVAATLPCVYIQHVHLCTPLKGDSISYRGWTWVGDLWLGLGWVGLNRVGFCRKFCEFRGLLMRYVLHSNLSDKIIHIRSPKHSKKFMLITYLFLLAIIILNHATWTAHTKFT